MWSTILPLKLTHKPYSQQFTCTSLPFFIYWVVPVISPFISWYYRSINSHYFTVMVTCRDFTFLDWFFAVLHRFIGFDVFVAMGVFMEPLQKYHVAGDASWVVSLKLKFHTVEGLSYNNYVICSLLQGSYYLHL